MVQGCCQFGGGSSLVYLHRQFEAANGCIFCRHQAAPHPLGALPRQLGCLCRHLIYVDQITKNTMITVVGLCGGWWPAVLEVKCVGVGRCQTYQPSWQLLVMVFPSSIEPLCSI